MPGEVVYATWRECRECDPPPRRQTLKTMTSAQIHKAIMDGDVRAPVALPYVEQARLRENAGRRMGVLRRWDNEWAQRWHFARAKLRTELRAVTERQHYAHKNPPRVGYEESVALFNYYRSVLRRIIQWMTEQAKNRAGRAHLQRMKQVDQRSADPWAPRPRGRRPRLLDTGRLDLVMDERSVWRHYLIDDEEERLVALWKALPVDIVRRRLPGLLLLATDDTVYCMRGFEAQQADQDAEDRRAVLAGNSVEPRASVELTKVKPAAPRPDCIDHGKKGFGPGYAHTSVNGKTYGMHRVAYAKHHGLKPDELPPVVRHTCDNPRCINPEHLVAGTHADNMRDKTARGRTGAGNMRSLTEAQVQEMQRLYAEGATQKQLAAEFGVGMVTVLRALRRTVQVEKAKPPADDWLAEFGL